MTWFDTRAGNQRRRSRTCAFGPTWAGAATITATAFGSRRALRAPSRSRPMHQPTRLGSAIWMIAPSAIFPVSSSAFGPYPAIHTGSLCRGAHSIVSAVPSYVTARPSQRSRMTFVASSTTASVVGGFPRTRRAESPRPIPRSMRPPESSCRTASVLAVTDGSRVAGFVTHVPRRSREVFCAMSARSTSGSFQGTWLSKTQPYAQPARPASFASRTTRSSGWSGFSVNPKSMEAAESRSAVPLRSMLHTDADHRRVPQRHALVLRILRGEEPEGVTVVLTLREHVGDAVDADPGAAAPGLLVVVDEDAHPAVGLDVLHASKLVPVVDRLPLRVDRRVQQRVLVDEDDGHDVRARVLVGGREVRDAPVREQLPRARTQLLVHARDRRRGRTSFA